MKREYVVKYMGELETTMVFRYDIYTSGIVDQYIVGFYAGMPDKESTCYYIDKDDCGGTWVCKFNYEDWAI